MEGLKPWFGFQGRAGVGEWWQRYVTICFVGAVAALVVTFVFPVSTPTQMKTQALIAMALFALPQISIAAITIRRLHDRNRSGWWLFGVIAVGGLVFEGASWTKSNMILVAAILVWMPVFFWGFWEIGFRRGSVGRNRFGDDPSLVGLSAKEPLART